MKYVDFYLLWSLLLILLGCSRQEMSSQPLPLPTLSQLHELESTCLGYHRLHQAQDEADAGVPGKVAFTDYRVLRIEPRPGAALVTFQVTQKTIASKRVYFVKSLSSSGPVPPQIEELWVYRRGQWTLSERTKLPNILFVD